jgi:anti-sigma-K factor RskA
MNPVDREALLDLVAAHALGVLPAAEVPLVTAFILSDPEAQAEYAALRPTADAIGLSAEEPVDSARSARMKDRLMSIVRAEAAAPNLVSIGRGRNAALLGTALAAAAAVVFALISTIQDFGLRSDLHAANARIAQMQTAIAADQQLHVREHTMVADLIAPDAQRFPVDGGDVVKRGEHVYFALRTLPALPKGKVYQVWTLAKGAKTVAPSVTFVPNASGLAVIALPENAENLAAVALSVEPEGGSKAPTSKPTFIRPLS